MCKYIKLLTNELDNSVWKIAFSMATCCKLLPTAGIVADIGFVSGVGALVYLREAHTKLCSSEADKTNE